MTTEPLEMYPEQIWEVSDPNTAKLIALFYDETEARKYLAWRNRPEPFVIGERVATQPYTDAWMAGDRFGKITKMGWSRVTVKCDSGKTRRFDWSDIKHLQQKGTP